MVNSVVLPTPRWPNTPIRCGRRKRSASATAGVEVRFMELCSRCTGVLLLPLLYFVRDEAILPTCRRRAKGGSPGDRSILQGGRPMRRGSLWILMICGIVIPGSAPFFAAAQEAKRAIRVEKGIVFGKGGATELQLDLAMPQDGEGPFPAIVCIHAGGWVAGNRQQMKDTIEVFARRGYVAISPDYRVAPRDRFPAQIHDCKAAVRWLRANAEKYHVDPNRIGAFGASAGGH